MKVLLVHNRYQQYGGEDSVVNSEINVLKDHGHIVYFYERSNEEFIEWSFSQKVRFVLFDLFSSKRVYDEIDDICKKFKPDVAHFHNTFFMISSSAFKACRHNNVKVIKTLHNYRLICPNALLFRANEVCEKCLKGNLVHALIYRCWRNSFFQTLISVLNIFYERLFKINEKYIDVFIALTEFSKSKFVSAGLDNTKIVVKNNFLDFDPQARKEAGKEVLYIGALADYKGVWDVIEIAKSLKGIKFSIVGRGPLEKDIIHEIQENNLSNIKLHGFLKGEQLYAHLKKASFLIAPSKCYEHFPRVVIESFACGVPVLARKAPVFQEIVSGNCGDFFETIEELQNKVLTLSKRKKLLDEYGQNARKVFENKFTTESNYNELMKIYKENNV